MSFFQPINQNSYTFAALTIFSISLVVVLARFHQTPAAWGVLIALALMLVAGNLVSGTLCFQRNATLSDSTRTETSPGHNAECLPALQCLTN